MQDMLPFANWVAFTSFHDNELVLIPPPNTSAVCTKKTFYVERPPRTVVQMNTYIEGGELFHCQWYNCIQYLY